MGPALCFLLTACAILLLNSHYILEQHHPPRTVQERSEADIQARIQANLQALLHLIVLTQDRPHSLERLLNSLATARYQGQVVDLSIHQDRRPDNTLCKETRAVSEQFRWTRGRKVIKVADSHQGIIKAWISAWQPRHPDELVLFLEDDLEVSKFFAVWLMAAHQRFRDSPDVCGISLMRPHLRASDPLGEGLLETSVPPNTRILQYRLFGTWGYSPSSMAWQDFRMFYTEKSRDTSYSPAVKGIKPSQFYERLRQLHSHHKMWSMWHIRFMHERKCFCVYPWFDSRETLVRSWRESGLHNEDTYGPDSPLLQAWSSKFVQWPTQILTLDYSGHPLPGTL